MSTQGAAIRVVFVTVLACIGAFPAEAPAAAVLVPMRVCEVLADLPSNQGKDLAVLGRYSFRESGRFLNEQACEAGSLTPQIRLTEDDTGPKPPGSFELDGRALRQKLEEMRARTELGKFRFGSPDYDRWAVVYGRVERPRSADANTPPELVFRGDGVIVFLTVDR